MIQPALLMYTVDNPKAQAVLLDIENMREDVILLLDAYFTVLVWYGSHIYNWKQEKVYEQEEYNYLTELFTNPIDDSSSVIYDRIPVPSFYETFKGDGKERYLKSRVNPSTINSDMVTVKSFCYLDWRFGHRRCSHQAFYGLPH
jgi:protein transport protein SEC23